MVLVNVFCGHYNLLFLTIPRHGKHAKKMISDVNRATPLYSEIYVWCKHDVDIFDCSVVGTISDPVSPPAK